MTVWDCLVPVLMMLILLVGTVRKTDVYGALLTGAEEGLRILLRITPALIILMSAVAILRQSGAMEALTAMLSPMLCRMGIPPETAPILLMRPMSGSGALATAGELMSTYGSDSRIGRTAAVMLGSTETTFYTIAVYFGAAKIRRTRYTVIAALAADLTGFLMAAWCVRRWFG